MYTIKKFQRQCLFAARNSKSYSRTILSKIFEKTELTSFFKIGVTLVIFQISGKTPYISDELKIIVRGFDSRSPTSFMIVVETLSGPAAFPFFNFKIAFGCSFKEIRYPVIILCYV